MGSATRERSGESRRNYLLIWYLGAVNQVPALDFLGAAQATAANAILSVVHYRHKREVVRQILRHLESPSSERPRGPPRVGSEPSALVF